MFKISVIYCNDRLTCDQNEGVSEAVVDQRLVTGEARLGRRQQDLERHVELDGVREEDRSGEEDNDDLGQPEKVAGDTDSLKEDFPRLRDVPF